LIVIDMLNRYEHEDADALTASVRDVLSTSQGDLPRRPASRPVCLTMRVPRPACPRLASHFLRYLRIYFWLVVFALA
jgi:hypothetical protein